MLRASLYTANEFVHATPAAVNENSIVITCSLGGNTPETVKLQEGYGIRRKGNCSYS